MFKRSKPVQTLAEAVRSELDSMFEWPNSNLHVAERSLMRLFIGKCLNTSLNRTRNALAEDCLDQGETPPQFPVFPCRVCRSIVPGVLAPWNCLAICFFSILHDIRDRRPIRPKPAALLHPSTRQSWCYVTSLVRFARSRERSLVRWAVLGRRVRWLASFASVLADGRHIRVRATSSCSLSKTKVGPRNRCVHPFSSYFP